MSAHMNYAGIVLPTCIILCLGGQRLCLEFHFPVIFHTDSQDDMLLL